MVVYVEYAFVYNFLLDGVLLWLSLRAAKAKVKWGKLLLSALFGALFALVFPLLYLPDFWAYFLRFAVGFLLCLLVSPRLKTKKEWGRYAFICIFFFSFTFAFAGAIFGIFGTGEARVAPALVLLSFAVLTAISAFLLQKLQEKRAAKSCTYDCAILYKQRRKAVFGFYDSGNFAEKNGLPVCFVSPEIVCTLFQEEILEEMTKDGGQVRDEIAITTMSGEKKLPVYKGGLEIKTKDGVFVWQEVYFSPSANMLSREYSLLLNSRIFEEKRKK